MIILTDFSYQGLDRAGVGYALPRIGVENRSARVFGLNVILEIEGLKDVIGEIDGELCGIRIEGLGLPLSDIVLVGADDIRIFLLVASARR